LVTLNGTPTGGAHIAWTDDGTNPVPGGNGHQNPTQSFSYNIRGHLETVTVTLKAIAYREGYEDSEMSEATYIVHFVQVLPPPRPVATPFLNPTGGVNLTFPFTVNIWLSDAYGAIIIYTLNDDNPTPTNGIQDAQSTNVILNEDTIIRAVGWRASDNQISHIVVGTYTGTGGEPPLDPPVLEPNSGEFTFPLTVNISQPNPDGGIIIYTVNDQVLPSWTHGTHDGTSIDITLNGPSTIHAIAAIDADHVSPAIAGIYTEIGTGGEGLGGPGDITVIVSDQDTVFGGVIVQPFTGTQISDQAPPLTSGEVPVDVPAGARLIYRPEIDSLAQLQALPSSALAVDTLIKITIDAAEQSWRVDPGAADPTDPGQIAPNDYDLDTNDKHYVRVL
jgi:hypothetical protein